MTMWRSKENPWHLATSFRDLPVGCYRKRIRPDEKSGTIRIRADAGSAIWIITD
jgi:hypothetical protein